MKTNKLLALLLVLPLIVSCGETPSETPSESIPSHQDSNKPTEPQTPSINVDNGTDAAKLLLANERLDSSVLEGSNNIFTKGKKAFSKIVNETRRYTVKYAGRPNETYTEIDGDTIKWYNDVDYSNFNSFFESYATNIENSALRGGQLIDDTKKYIRVIGKWVNVGGQEYLLKVNEVSETSFLNNVPEALKTSTIYLLEVDEETGFIYVGTSDYNTNGTIYQFDQNGKFLRQFDSGGINPSAMVFID